METHLKRWRAVNFGSARRLDRHPLIDILEFIVFREEARTDLDHRHGSACDGGHREQGALDPFWNGLPVLTH